MSTSENHVLNPLFIKDSVIIAKSERRQSSFKIEEKCNKQECIDRLKSNLPLLKAPSKKQREEWIIKALPTDWTPVVRPTGVLERVTERRRLKHEAVVSEMKDKMVDTNTKIETQLRLESEHIKRMFLQTKTDSEKLLEKLTGDDDKLLQLLGSDFCTTKQEIINIHKHCKGMVSDYHSFLQQLEKSRTHYFKRILKDAYAVLHEVSYLLPYELQKFFEHEILNINQITLNNLRWYSNLCTDLSLQTENNVRKWLQTVSRFKQLWKDAFKRQVVHLLHERQAAVARKTGSLLIETDDTRTATATLDKKKNEISELMAQQVTLPIKSEEVNQWLITTEENIKSLDYSAKILVNLYRAAIVQVFNGYFEEFEQITEKMIDRGMADKEDVVKLSAEVYAPIIENLNKNYGSQITDLRALWDRQVHVLQEKVKSTAAFLNGCARLFDRHQKRTEDIQSTILSELRKLIEKNNKASQLKETKINIAVDALRQEPTEAKLEKALKNVNKLMDALQTIFLTHCSNEIQIIAKYTRFADEEINIMVLELRQYLNAFPKKTDSRSFTCLNMYEECPDYLPKQVVMCEYQVEAVHNWMIGLWEAIDNYLLTCRDELLKKAAKWVRGYQQKLGKRLEVKKALQQTRCERVKIHIYETRLAELRAHAERLERHKKGAQMEIEKLNDDLAAFQAKHQHLATQFAIKAEEIFEKQKNSETSHRTKVRLMELIRIFEMQQKEIQELEKQHEDIVQARIENVINSGLEYTQSTKLFSEDGNYSPDEMKATVAVLMKMEQDAIRGIKDAARDFKVVKIKEKRSIASRASEIRRSLETNIHELEYSEKTIKEIKELQDVMKGDVLTIKIQIKRLNVSWNRLKDQALKNKGELTYLDKFQQDLQTLAAKVAELQQYLIYYEDEKGSVVIELTQKASVTSRVSKAVSTSSRATVKSRQSIKSSRHSMRSSKHSLRSSRHSSMRSSKKSSSSTTSSTASSKQSIKVDYRSFLFQKKPTNSNNFLSQFCTKLYNSFERLQIMSMDFYGRLRHIQYPDKTQSTFKGFMEDSLAKYKSYNVQGELVWLDFINDILLLIQDIFQFLISYRTIYLESMLKLRLEEDERTHTLRMADIEKHRNANLCLLENVHSKMKPLHGHPNNRALMKDLEVKFSDTKKQIIENDSLLTLIEYEKWLWKERDIFLNTIANAMDTIKQIKDNIMNTLINVSLIDQFEKKLDYLEVTLLSQDKVKLECDLKDMSKRLGHLKDFILVTPGYRVNLGSIKSVISFTQAPEDVLAEKENINYIHSQQLIETLSKIFITECEKKIQELNEIRDIHRGISGKWDAMWKEDFEKLTQIFTVKYE